VGAAVTIAGANFGSTQGTSTVAFNGTLATPSTWSQTSLVVPVPSGATTGSVVVTVGGQASNGVTFTVTTPPPPVSVAFDAVGPSSAGASVASGAGLSWSHTVTATGSNLLLTVAVAVGTNSDVGLSLAVAYNGVPMTSAALVHSNNHANGFVQMFYLRAPASGTHTVQVTLSGGTASLEGGSVSFTGVDQTTPVRNIATSFGSSGLPRVTVASAIGDMVLDAMVTGCNGTITSTRTLRWLKALDCNTAGGNGAQSTAAGDVSVTMGYSVPSDFWGMIGVDLVAASGP
jgi:hypothetical protein